MRATKKAAVKKTARSKEVEKKAPKAKAAKKKAAEAAAGARAAKKKTAKVAPGAAAAKKKTAKVAPGAAAAKKKTAKVAPGAAAAKKKTAKKASGAAAAKKKPARVARGAAAAKKKTARKTAGAGAAKKKTAKVAAARRIPPPVPEEPGLPLKEVRARLGLIGGQIADFDWLEGLYMYGPELVEAPRLERVDFIAVFRGLRNTSRLKSAEAELRELLAAVLPLDFDLKLTGTLEIGRLLDEGNPAAQALLGYAEAVFSRAG